MKISVYVCTPETTEGQLDLVASGLDTVHETVQGYVRAAALLNPDWIEITVVREPITVAQRPEAEPSGL